jgi:fucose 4-O-acetylase-like acetyltransferase
VLSEARQALRLKSADSRKVENLRALACLLLVAFHTIGTDVGVGLHVPADSWVRLVMDLVRPARMPLFMFLSGYVYAMRPIVHIADARGLLRRKAARLLIPLLLLAPLFMAGQQLSNGQRLDVAGVLLGAYVFPKTYYWYLEALMGIFLIVVMLERFGALATLRRTGACVLFALALNLLQPLDPNPFAIGHLVAVLPCFLAGIAVRRFGGELMSAPALLAAMLLYLIYASARITGLTDYLSQGSLTLLVAAAGCGICLLLFRFAPSTVTVSRIGLHSFAVYLFHQYFITLAAKSLPAVPFAAQFAIPLAAGMIGPLLLEKVLRRSRWATFLLLGEPLHRGERAVRTLSPSPPPDPLLAETPRLSEPLVAEPPLAGRERNRS